MFLLKSWKTFSSMTVLFLSNKWFVSFYHWFWNMRPSNQLGCLFPTSIPWARPEVSDLAVLERDLAICLHNQCPWTFPREMSPRIKLNNIPSGKRTLTVTEFWYCPLYKGISLLFIRISSVQYDHHILLDRVAEVFIEIKTTSRIRFIKG